MCRLEDLRVIPHLAKCWGRLGVPVAWENGWHRDDVALCPPWVVEGDDRVPAVIETAVVSVGHMPVRLRLPRMSTGRET